MALIATLVCVIVFILLYFSMLIIAVQNVNAKGVESSSDWKAPTMIVSRNSPQIAKVAEPTLFHKAEQQYQPIQSTISRKAAAPMNPAPTNTSMKMECAWPYRESNRGARSRLAAKYPS